MPQNCRVIFCKDQSEINAAVQRWVNEEGYKRVHTSTIDRHALHYLKASGGYTRSSCTPTDKFKHVILFEK